ncbi:hypothetical protein Ddye_028199 [Dipteronia dyeriana]|uniref:Uncharacterized protein n=1 Tax=Dipteronia dyeriana TaxID=168575 RepID=A0AAD9TQI8_9ROSI|nr:hypothetical protein Ddye_028199 [Dipteronia dyeriana]
MFYKNVEWRRRTIRCLLLKKLSIVERELLEEKFYNDDLDIRRNIFGRNKTESDRRGKYFEGYDNYNFGNDDERFRLNGKMDNRRNSMNDGSRSSRGSHGDNREAKWDKYDGRRMNNKEDDAQFRSNGKMDNIRDSVMNDRR